MDLVPRILVQIICWCLLVLALLVATFAATFDLFQTVCSSTIAQNRWCSPTSFRPPSFMFVFSLQALTNIVLVALGLGLCKRVCCTENAYVLLTAKSQSDTRVPIKRIASSTLNHEQKHPDRKESLSLHEPLRLQEHIAELPPTGTSK